LLEVTRVGACLGVADAVRRVAHLGKVMDAAVAFIRGFARCHSITSNEGSIG
jgi:hypothetical protein